MLTAAYGHILAAQWKDCLAECEAALGQRPPPATTARLLLAWHVAKMHNMAPPCMLEPLREMTAGTSVSTEEWPGPLLQAIVGGRSFEEFVGRLAESLEEHIARRRLCQACYYYGMSDLGAGRFAQAKDKFHRALAVGLRHHIEFTLADAELRRLGAR